MKNKTSWLIGLLFILASCNKENRQAANTAHKQPATAAITLNNYTDTVSYALGINIARTLQQNGAHTVNTALLAQAIQDYLSHQPTLLPPGQTIEMVNEHFKKLLEQQVAANRAEEDTFLSQNKNKPGVITLPSGLQYQVIKDASGDIPTATDIVTLHYHATFIDGTVFDSSVQRGKPVQMPVDRCLPAYTQALQLMPVGAKWKLFIPAALAYGSSGYQAGSASVPPDKAMVVELELIAIAR